MTKSSEEIFEELRHLILEGDRNNNDLRYTEILEKIDLLEKELNDPEKFAGVIQQSKEEVIDVLGPVMGKMIKKFVSSEIEKLRQNIDKKRKAIFSFSWLKQKIKNKAAGVSDADAAISDSIGNRLLQLFVIEKKSGILIGEYSPKNILDPDLIAGMLSAIKSFIESAFGDSDSELESLSYSNYKILLFNFNRFYFACVMEGIVDADVEAQLQDDFLHLVDEELGAMSLKHIDDQLKEKVEASLNRTFSEKYGLGNEEENEESQ